MGIFDRISNIDPTTSSGLTNILTGGLVGGLADPDSALQSVDDAISGQQQKDDAKEAARIREQAALAGVDLSREQFESIQGKLDPFYQAGLGGLDDHARLLSQEGYDEFQANYLDSDPYKQRQGNVIGALEASKAFEGTLGSGGTAKDVGSYLNRFALDDAQREYQSRLDASSELVGLGKFGVTGQADASRSFLNSAIPGLNNAASAQSAGVLAGSPAGIAPYLQLAGKGAQVAGAFV